MTGIRIRQRREGESRRKTTEAAEGIPAAEAVSAAEGIRIRAGDGVFERLALSYYERLIRDDFKLVVTGRKNKWKKL
jgi:hypothetical protein